MLEGLVRYANTPSCQPSSAEPTVPWPVSMITSTSSLSLFISCNVLCPSIPGIFTSRIATSMAFCFSSSSASNPLLTAVTWNPRFLRVAVVVTRKRSSSSASKTLIFLFASILYILLKDFSFALTGCAMLSHCGSATYLSVLSDFSIVPKIRQHGIFPWRKLREFCWQANRARMALSDRRKRYRAALRGLNPSIHMP